MKAGTAEALTTDLKTNFVGIYEYSMSVETKVYMKEGSSISLYTLTYGSFFYLFCRRLLQKHLRH